MKPFFKDGSNTPITIDASANPVRIDAPDITMVGQSVSSESTIDSKNSDLHLAATSDLVGFGYSVRAIANPEGIQDNFLLDDSQLDINIEGLIPLHLRMQDVVLADTFNFFDLGSDEDAEFSQENIDSMMVRLETDNSMPLNLGIQVYFVDSAQNWIRLDSLFKDDRDVFLSGVIDADGRVIRATNKVTSVELTRSQIKNIVDADKLLLKAFIDTPENETRDVKFYSGNALKFKLGTRIAVNYTHEPEN